MKAFLTQLSFLLTSAGVLLLRNMDQRLNIVLLGNTGVGKSASANTILGLKAFKSQRAFKSVTTQCSEAAGNVCGRQISVIETPGISCAGDEEQIKNSCQDVLHSARPCLFLVVIKIDRFTDEQKPWRQLSESSGIRG